MATLSNLRLVAARKPRALPESIRRRNKLIRKLSEQRELAAAHRDGQTYTPKRLRTVRDAATGERAVREMPVRVKAWWWNGDKGEILLSLFYGSKTLEIAKGKTAIEVVGAAELVNVLDLIIDAVKNGELDAQMETASVKLRDGFTKSK